MPPETPHRPATVTLARSDWIKIGSIVLVQLAIVSAQWGTMRADIRNQKEDLDRERTERKEADARIEGTLTAALQTQAEAVRQQTLATNRVATEIAELRGEMRGSGRTP